MSIVQYYRTDDVPSPQLLCVQHHGQTYQLNLVHATLDEQRQGSPVPRAPHAHAYYHILLFTAGNNAFLLGDQPTPSRPGTLVLCPPNLPHDFGPIASGLTTYDEITFELAYRSGSLELPFNDLLSLYAAMPLAPLPLATSLSPRLMMEVRALMAATARSACSGAPASLFEAHRGLLDLLAMLAQRLGQVPAADCDKIAEARRQIARRFADPISIDLLARELALAPTYLSHAFHRRYGTSPVAYRQELRVSAARRLLQMGALNCKEIAARLGFADVQTFCKAFTRRYGVSPGQMRTKLARPRSQSLDADARLHGVRGARGDGHRVRSRIRGLDTEHA